MGVNSHRWHCQVLIIHNFELHMDTLFSRTPKAKVSFATQTDSVILPWQQNISDSGHALCHQGISSLLLRYNLLIYLCSLHVLSRLISLYPALRAASASLCETVCVRSIIFTAKVFRVVFSMHLRTTLHRPLKDETRERLTQCPKRVAGSGLLTGYRGFALTGWHHHLDGTAAKWPPTTSQAWDYSCQPAVPLYNRLHFTVTARTRLPKNAMLQESQTSVSSA